MFDILITGAEVIDGSGAPAFRADVAISGEVIVEVGDLTGAEAGRKIAATGLLLTPGFIDVHTHGDTSILVNPVAESKLRQGITTQIVGNCGSSAFPLKGERLSETRESLAKYDIVVDWDSAEGYFKRLKDARPAINVASLVGQGTIRASIMGDRDVPPNADELREMKAEVERAIVSGAIGLSTGLIYAPGYFASQEEITELARVAAQWSGLYASHIRGEGDTLLEAITEALAIGRDADCGVQVSHLKASAPRNWGKVRKAIDLIEAAEAGGLDVYFDKYPYTAGSTGLAIYVPRWARGEGVEKLIKYLRDPSERAKIFREADAENEGEEKWASIILISAECKEYRDFEGKNIKEIAEKLGRSIKDIFADILIKSRAGADIVCFTQSQEDTDLALIHRLGLVCTDSGVWAPYGPLSKIKPHPRAYGTFPRFFRQYVKEKKALTREAAVEKATGKSARRFGISKRGFIKKGCFADVVLLDWDSLRDTATYTDPHRYPEGIEGVLVNGALTLWRGKTTGLRAGKVLRKSGDSVV